MLLIRPRYPAGNRRRWTHQLATVAGGVSDSPGWHSAGGKSGGGTKTEVSVASILIQDGTLGYRDDRTNKVTTLGLPRLEATAASPDSPLHLDADATFNGTAFNLAGDTGSLTRLQEPTATTPWPVKLTLTAGTRSSARMDRLPSRS